MYVGLITIALCFCFRVILDGLDVVDNQEALEKEEAGYEQSPVVVSIKRLLDRLTAIDHALQLPSHYCGLQDGGSGNCQQVILNCG